MDLFLCVSTVKKEMPKFLKKPDNVEVYEYEEARMETVVTGKPQPKVEWLQGKQKLEPSDRILYEEDGENYALVIKDVKKEEAGMVTVTATNDQGTMSASARLKVTRKYEGHGLGSRVPRLTRADMRSSRRGGGQTVKRIKVVA